MIVCATHETLYKQVIAAVWEYIKLKDLQSKTDAGWIMCDQKLKIITKAPRFKLSSLSTFLNPHLHHLPPIEIKYMIPGQKSFPKIRLNANEPDEDYNERVVEEDMYGAKEAHCYDVKVSLPPRTVTEGHGFIERSNPEAEINQLNSELQAIVSKVSEHSRRRDFFLGFSSSPYDFIKDLTISQSRDLGVMMNRQVKEIEARRKSDFYKRKWAGEACLRYLNKNKPGDMPM